MKTFIDGMFKNINNVIIHKYSTYEFMLNLLFILILGFIFYTLYYNSINTTAYKKSKCKNDRINNNEDDFYYVYAKNNDNNKLFNIKYNMKDKKCKLECACDKGNVLNNFKGIVVYEKNSKGIIERKTRNLENCACDKDYIEDYNNKDFTYSGESFILDAMNNNLNQPVFPL